MADPTVDQTRPDPSIASMLGAASAPEPGPSTAGGPPLDPNDRDMLIKTVYGEASNQPPLGQVGIVHAILNRVAAGGLPGSGAPGQPGTGAPGMTGLLGLMQDPTAQTQVQLPTDVPMTGMSGLLYSGGAGLGIRRPAVTRLT